MGAEFGPRDEIDSPGEDDVYKLLDESSLSFWRRLNCLSP